VTACLGLKTEQDILNSLNYPDNLGETKLFFNYENKQYYYLGLLTDNDEYFLKATRGNSTPSSMIYYNDESPETIFYQGLAFLKLNKFDEATQRFDSLVAYADKHMNDEVKIDYFAVSLPDLLVFDENLNTKNKVECLFMKALGLYGKGEKTESKALFEKALALNPNHFSLLIQYKMLFEEH